MAEPSHLHHVVIIGGGFGGLYAAKALSGKPVQVTLIDKRNFHLFQPLLYQVATGGLSPGDISYPLRSVLRRAKNVSVQAAEVVDILPDRKEVVLHDSRIGYDSLILATGAGHSYFGRDEWAEKAPGLKTIEDALDIRRRILLAFESAEREPDPEKRRGWLNFVIVGGGPTGVELAGAISELAHSTLRDNYRRYDPETVEVILLEGLDRLLTTFDESLSGSARKTLEKKGVTVLTNTLMTEVGTDCVTVRDTGSGETRDIPTRTVLWAAGVKASPIGQTLAERAEIELDRIGRVVVNPDLSVPGCPGVYVIGDLAHYAHQDGEPLPGVAQVAMQMGDYAARLIVRRLDGESLPPFRYRDKGTMAVIGRSAAVCDIRGWRTRGFLAWLIWSFIHIYFLIGFDNKVLVFIQWAWHFFTRKRGALLITGPRPFPVVGEEGER